MVLASKLTANTSIVPTLATSLPLLEPLPTLSSRSLTSLREFRAISRYECYFFIASEFIKADQEPRNARPSLRTLPGTLLPNFLDRMLSFATSATAFPDLVTSSSTLPPTMRRLVPMSRMYRPTLNSGLLANKDDQLRRHRLQGPQDLRQAGRRRLPECKLLQFQLLYQC